jgi:hypothetical protein
VGHAPDAFMEDSHASDIAGTSSEDIVEVPDIPTVKEVNESPPDDGPPIPDVEAPTTEGGSGPSAVCSDANPGDPIQDLGEVRAAHVPGAHHSGDCGLITWATSDGALMLHQLQDGTTMELLSASAGAGWPHQSCQDIVLVAGEPGQVVHYDLASGSRWRPARTHSCGQRSATPCLPGRMSAPVWPRSA